MRFIDVYTIVASSLTLVLPFLFLLMARSSSIRRGRHFAAAAFAVTALTVLGTLYVHSLVVSIVAVATGRTLPAVATAAVNAIIGLGLLGATLARRRHWPPRDGSL